MSLSTASFYISAGGIAVYPLWEGSVADAIEQVDEIRGRLRFGLAIVGTLPNQVLDTAQLDAMESAGLLALEIPASMANCTNSDLLAYVINEVDGADADRVVYRQSLLDLVTEEEEENELLRLINDCESDEGTC